MKKWKYIISLGCIAFSILVIVCSTFFSGPYREDQVLRIDGIFKEYVVNSSWVDGIETTRYIQLQDGSRYEIDSVTRKAFNEGALIENVKTGDPIELIVEKYNRIRPSVLAIYKGGQEFMNYEKAQKENLKNQKTGYVLGAVFFVLGLIVLMIPMSQYAIGTVPNNGHPQSTHTSNLQKRK